MNSQTQTKDTAAIAAASPCTRLRPTTRGRRVLAALVAAPVAAALAWGALGSQAAVADSASSEAGVTFDAVTVAEGDSLWRIAQQVAPEADPREVVDAIVSLNQLPSSLVAAGDVLSIPVQYSK